MSQEKEHWKIGSEREDVSVLRKDRSITLKTADGREKTFEANVVGQGEVLLSDGAKTVRAFFARADGRVHVAIGARTWTLERTAPETRGRAAGEDAVAEICSPMAGRVVRVACAAGDVVEEGRLLVSVEAMKMEYQLKAPFTGKVEIVTCVEAKQVGHGETLVRFVRVTAEK